jgi:5-methylcytosine-specific restriction endonuclease McrA
VQDLHRPSPARRGYDGAWRKLRLVILDRDPVCTLCHAALSSVVDHIEPIALAPQRRLDPSNLRGLCKSCHDRRTALDQGFASVSKKRQ